MNRMTRRQFLIRSALLTATAMIADARWLLADRQWAISDRPPAGGHEPVVVARGADYAEKLKQAIGKLGGERAIVRRGERVLIKPTLAWNRAPGQGANVHPEVLRATIEMALRAGARQVVIFDRTSLPSHFAYSVSGAKQVVREINDPHVRLVQLAEEDFIPFEMTADRRPPAASTCLSSYRVCRYLLDADRVINLATARHHPTRRASLGMANLLGLTGGAPADAEWLRHRDAELAVLSAAVRPELTILDATRAIIRNGPMGRGAQDVARWDTLVVSRDPLAVEAYGAQLFGLDPGSLLHLGLAERLGLGVSDVGHARLIEV